MPSLLRDGVRHLHHVASRTWSGDSTERQVLVSLAELVGREDEAAQYLGTGEDFWSDRSTREVHEALKRLPLSLVEGRWADALREVVTVRALHLIRLAACLSKSSQVPSFPEHPVPVDLIATPTQNHGLPVSVEVFMDNTTPWAEFALCIEIESGCTITLLHAGVRLSSGVVSTHPLLTQDTKRNTVRVECPEKVHTLISGRVRDTGRTTLSIAGRSIKKYDPQKGSGRELLRTYISHALKVAESEVMVEHGGSRRAVVTFPTSHEADGLQAALLHHRTEVWDARSTSAPEEADIRIEFPNRPGINLALSGRSGASLEVSEEVVRQRISRVLTKGVDEGGWQAEVVAAVMEQGIKSRFCDELLWCAAAGCVDVDDENERASLAESCARECYVPNTAPRSPMPHKRHHLHDPTPQHPMRAAALALNAAILRAIPLVDPVTAAHLGASV